MERSEIYKAFDKAKERLTAANVHIGAIGERTSHHPKGQEAMLICREMNDAVLGLRLAIQAAFEEKRQCDTAGTSWQNWINNAQKVEVQLASIQDKYIPPTKPQ